MDTKLSKLLSKTADVGLGDTLPSVSIFDNSELAALEHLRSRYHAGHDDWSERELAHLLFLRWLRQSGRLDS